MTLNRGWTVCALTMRKHGEKNKRTVMKENVPERKDMRLADDITIYKRENSNKTNERNWSR